MGIYILWHGGSSYSHGEARDVETFPTLDDAKDAMSSRQESGYWQKQDFRYVNRDWECVFTPNVEGDSAWFWFDNPTADGDWVNRDPYPDLVIDRAEDGTLQVDTA